MTTDPSARGGGSLVDVDLLYGLAWRARETTADGVVEDEYLLDTPEAFFKESLDFGVVFVADEGFIGEGLFDGGRAEDREAGVVLKMGRYQLTLCPLWNRTSIEEFVVAKAEPIKHVFHHHKADSRC